ncbi:PcfJ domain-containing protein [Ruminococcus sp. 5_1_39BFAA]|uniref:PcfJ domain-containing protein n=1 Tax=Ruminococcus sp. 5_1_39BFAA TaxID=457412 RepID=UPI00356962C6
MLIEGQKLQHCIHQNERYFERMNKRESYILFLRKTNEDSVPYYTLEVEPNGTVRQKRTLFNRQLEDIEEAEGFLQKWQKQLQMKLHREDFELAKRSKELRIKEMEELRRQQVRLHGNFNGRLLADVLAEDLMEVTETEPLAA